MHVRRAPHDDHLEPIGVQEDSNVPIGVGRRRGRWGGGSERGQLLVLLLLWRRRRWSWWDLKERRRTELVLVLLLTRPGGRHRRLYIHVETHFRTVT